MSDNNIKETSASAGWRENKWIRGAIPALLLSLILVKPSEKALEAKKEKNK